MKPLFYEFLIETGRLTTEAAVEALITQLRSTPSPAEVVYDLELMSKTDLLQILKHQQQYSLDFYSSARELNLWSEDISKKIDDHLYSVRRPWSEILIKKGHLPVETLAAMLDAYAGNMHQKAAAEPSNGFAGDILVSDNNLALKPETSPTLDPVLVQEYVEFYQHKSRPAINIAAAQLKDDVLTRNQLQAVFKQAHSEFSALWAAAKFLGASKSEDVAHRVVNILKLSANRDEALNHASTYSALFSAACFVLDGLVTKLSDFNNEDYDVEDTNMSDLVARLDKTLNVFEGLIIKVA